MFADEGVRLGTLKIPAVVPTARTQLAPTAHGELQAIDFRQAVEQSGDITRIEGVAASRAINERHGIRADPGTKVSDTVIEPRSPQVITTRRAPSR